MSKNREVAKKWVDEHVVLAEHCDIEYSDLYESLTVLLDAHSTTKQCLNLSDGYSVKESIKGQQFNKKDK